MPEIAGYQIASVPHAPIDVAHKIMLAARRDMTAGQWDAALAKWRQVREVVPDDPIWVQGVARALMVLGRTAETDACYAEAMRIFPDNAEIACGFAQAAAHRSDWAAAVTRWQHAARRFPDNAPAAAGLGTTLLAARQVREAEAVLKAATERFPDDPGVAAASARIAAARHDWPEALTRWQRVMARFPDDVAAQIGVGMALRELGRFDEADQLLWAATERFPKNSALFFNLAWVPIRRRDWPEALRRWELYRERFGETDIYVKSRGYILSVAKLDRLDAALSRSETADAPAGAAAVPAGEIVPDAVAEADQSDLLLNFENLGDDCLFGFVQRFAGLEPIGLLRWANVPIRHLLDMLRSRFQGVGEAEFTEIYTEADGELWVRDSRHDLRTHTFVFETSLSGARRARFGQLMCGRFRFLRDQLIGDLEAGRKIFAFKSADPLSAEEIGAVHDRVAAYGPGWVLHLRPPDAAHPAGTVRHVRDRLMIGHATMVATDQPGWRRVCEAALALRARAGNPG